MNIKYILLFLSQLFILWVLNQFGSLIVNWLDLPIPGNVLGMMILFTLLMTGVIKLEWINEASSFLLKHLVFFFIPITVGVMTLGDVFLESGILLIVVLVVSGAFGMVVTGWVSQLLAKRREGVAEHGRSHNNI